MTPPDRSVEVFTPSQAPHLARTTRALEQAIAGELDQALPDPGAVARVVALIEDEAKLQAAFARFRAALFRKVGIDG